MKNPFHKIVALFSDTPTTVTMQLLDNVRDIMKKDGNLILNKYSEAFDVLEYLHNHKAITINYLPSGSYTITKNV